jgi:hypothetical protein
MISIDAIPCRLEVGHRSRANCGALRLVGQASSHDLRIRGMHNRATYSISAFSRSAVRVGAGADASLSGFGVASAGGAASATGRDFAIVVEPEPCGATGGLVCAAAILSPFSAVAERLSSGVSTVRAWIGGGPSIAVRTGMLAGAFSA